MGHDSCLKMPRTRLKSSLDWRSEGETNRDRLPGLNIAVCAQRKAAMSDLPLCLEQFTSSRCERERRSLTCHGSGVIPQRRVRATD